jgi:GTPase SAR1 family protein
MGRYKVLVAGPAQVGKTSIVQRSAFGIFRGQKPLTSLREFESTLIPDFAHSGEDVELEIWDLPGQDCLPVVSDNFFAGAGGAFVVCDIKTIGLTWMPPDGFGTLKRD